MMTRHVQLKYFTCMKSLYYIKSKPFFDAKTALKTHPREYEKKFLYFYLSSICENICDVLGRAFYSKDRPLDTVLLVLSARGSIHSREAAQIPYIGLALSGHWSFLLNVFTVSLANMIICGLFNWRRVH
ncbi:unnamed protein product [Porites lobata]|uniref:Uncharacterized protein n=1 Tax=Porites lobata TaxID=104759 RepID=A0ABN8N072_9CNID|nr:unnamed protein product [Porites lobata]